MFILDLFTFGLELIKIHMYGPFLEILELMKLLGVKLSLLLQQNEQGNFIYNYFLILFNYGLSLWNSYFTFIEESTDSILKTVPLYVLQSIRISLLMYKYLYNLRLLICWFPMYNPFKGPLFLITEPIDFFVRPFYNRLPKIPYIDVNTWVFGGVIDFITSIFDFLIEVSIVFRY